MTETEDLGPAGIRLSPSQANTYQECPAQWAATYVNGRYPRVVSPPADMGTAAHAGLDEWAIAGHWKKPMGAESRAMLIDSFTRHFEEMLGSPLGENAELYAEGKGLLTAWLMTNAETWRFNVVQSTEKKRTFALETTGGEVRFLYIIDRVDADRDGRLKVVDYKTGHLMLGVSELRQSMQALSYATGVWRHKPNQGEYEVVFDYLRSKPISATFTAAECEAHYHYLQRLAQRMHDALKAEEWPEKVGKHCRFCVRRSSCESLGIVEERGPIELNGDTPRLVDALARHDLVQKAASKERERIEVALVEALLAGDDHMISGHTGVAVELGTRVSRRVNKAKAKELLGLTGSPTIKALTAMAEGGDLEMAAKVSACIDHEVSRSLTLKGSPDDDD